MPFDLNCDLGEGEAAARTTALMRVVTSVNVACGGHAGDVESMRRVARQAKKFGVRLGAHPGSPTPGDFGRGRVTIDAGGLELLLLQQIGVLERIAMSERVTLHHIKLHGSLYHATESDPKLARSYLQIVRRWWPKLVVYALAGGIVERAGRRIGHMVWPEVFLDRNYCDDGSLVPRSEGNALVSGRAQTIERLRLLITRNAVRTINGKLLRLRVSTVCIHSDTPNAVRYARLARFCQVGRENGIR